MKINCQHHEEYTIFTLRGELVGEEVDEFRKSTLDEMDSKTHDFILDMSQVQSIDSKGLEAILWLQDQCIEKLGQIRLAACTDNVNTILRITRLNEALEASKNIQEAIHSLKA